MLGRSQPKGSVVDELLTASFALFLINAFFSLTVQMNQITNSRSIETLIHQDIDCFYPQLSHGDHRYE